MLRVGDVLAGKYRIEAVLGRGGMSVVYRATQSPLDRQVAIKLLSASALAIPEYVARLEREARAVSMIRSEHVARVYDIAKWNGVPYLVMEYLQGADLAATLAKRGPLPPPLAVECIMQACEALAEAHALGILHRDLKPANLYLSEHVDGSPCVKVLDFGISRTRERGGVSSLTDPGTVLGTPSYMAPEQMEGGYLDARADIWALGAILFELLTGFPAYAGETLPQIFSRIMKQRTPRPSRYIADVPPALDGVVARCLAVDPELRFASVAELAWALSETLKEPTARDSAARISRVLDRVSAETPAEPMVLQQAARGRARPRRRRPAATAVAWAVAATMAATGGVLGLLAGREASAPAALSPSSASRTAASPGLDDDDIAIALLPLRRRPSHP